MKETLYKSPMRAAREVLRRRRAGSVFLAFSVLAALVASGAGLPVHAEEDASGAPLSGEDAVRSGDTLVRFLWARQMADEALRQGLPSVAESLYREALDALPDGDHRRPELQLQLSSALLAQGKTGGAEEVLERYQGVINDVVLLRRAMLSWWRQEWNVVRYRLYDITEGALPENEYAWFAFLQGSLSEFQNRPEEADEWYERAEAAAISENQRAQFVLARYRARLSFEEPDEDLAEAIREEMEARSGEEVSLQIALQYVYALEALGRVDEAIEVARANRQRVPAVRRELRDRFLLVEGLIRGADTGEGWAVFQELLETGETRRFQRAALYELGRALPDEEASVRFGALLESLIEGEEPHGLVDELLVFQSRMALARRDYERASEDAQRVLSHFPGSRLKKDALRILAHAAWEEEKFRTAADYVAQLRDEIPDGEGKSELGVLIGDCYFRAQDYGNAADAYGNVMRENPGGISHGLLLFQRVQAELHRGRQDRAAEHLDNADVQTLADLDFRWQAEWNLIRHMQQTGRLEDAYERVSAFMENGERYPLPSALRIRFRWVQAKLSYDAGRPEDALAAVEQVFIELSREEEGDGLSAGLRESIHRHGLLLQAQALLATGETEDGVALLHELRERHGGTESAAYSYLVEARHNANMGQTVEAHRLLVALSDEYRESPYAPIALYEAALNTLRAGMDDGYQERAIGRLEQLVERYPEHELAFYARLKQGDILRGMNRFGTARQIYEVLETRYPNHPDWFRVKISLADTYLAQGDTGDSDYLERALTTLERLYDLPNLTRDMKAEAGFKYAFAYQKLGDMDRAREIFWMVVTGILNNDESESELLGSRGRYWVSRSVLHLGQLLEESERWDEALEAYTLILSHRLPGQTLALSRISPLTPQRIPDG